MPNFNEVGVTSGNLDAFLDSVEKFSAKAGIPAAQRWLSKLNPEVDRHLQMEYNSCGDGYFRSTARTLVFGEYDHQPLPQRCEHCGDVCWYRATSSVMKCQACGEIDLDKQRYLDL